MSADRLIGTPADEATALLERLGLVVQRRDVPSAGTAGLVVGVDRTGQVPLGTTVTLDVAVAPAAASPSAPATQAPSSSGGTAVSTGTPSTSGRSAPTSKGAAKPKAPRQGKGAAKGKGGGKDRGKG
ncbi:hypothetical protein AERO_16940 [Aeromicrobium fastidiosum]|uniref:hypothetical protein n=1 Tax=Aeromicrobium fastidiosum TaxID=52699 RepID=UPI0020231B4A|nr:hypothetical protein [Aeromicrobium fastidiosum]MCL8253075.1 hypothetical protein [Aeromicrobium fastidiosum]